MAQPQQETTHLATNCPTSLPRPADHGWADHNTTSAGARPATPAAPGLSGDGGGARAAAARQGADTPTRSATASSPAARSSASLYKGARHGSGSLTGLLKQRPGTAGEAGRAASPGSPMFELRGAAVLPPDPPPRPASTTPAAGDAVRSPVQHKFASHPVFNVHARAGPARPATAGPAAPAAGHAPLQRRGLASTVVAAHGLDLGASPAAQHQQRSRPSTAPLRGATAASPLLYQQQQQQQAPAPPPQQQQQPSALSVASSSLSDASSSLQTASRTSSGGSARSGGRVAAAAVAYVAAIMHQNPLYSGGSDGPEPGHPRQQQQQQQPWPATQQVRSVAAAAAAAQQQQQQQQRPSPPPVRVSPPPQAGSSTPPPAAFFAPAASGTPGPSPHATLAAVSNLTMADSRPISPSPWGLSTLPSGALPEGSHRSDRPTSPQRMDSTPPTPGSFAPLSAAAAASGRMLSPLRTGLSAGAAPPPPASRSLPTSPAPPAAMQAASSSGVAAGPSAVAAFRVPIFNQDGRLVGYKQNSNLIGRPGPCMSSAPSSPSRSAFLPDAATASFSAAPDSTSPLAFKAAPAPPLAPCDDFRDAAADPFKGFPDADNVVPGYLLGPILGKGGFCSVRKALHELTGQAVACKIIEKGKLKDPKDRDRVDRECRVMRNLANHVGVIKLFEYVETRDCVYVFMEAAKRGSLLDYVREKKRLPEEEAVTVFQQLLHALQFCHRKDVVHRDIKLENILIDAAGHMKLIDFGLCGYFVADKRLRCHCGSPSYAAPEIVARKDYLGPPVDVWSLGVVLFAMLSGYLPFHAKEKKQLSEKILAGVYKPAAWMSGPAQDLLARMLTLDPDQRITLEACWAHPWVASAPRWEPSGVGAGRLYRALTDPASGAVLPDEPVMAQLEALGADTPSIRRALRLRECNSLTAAYHLQLEAHLEAQRLAAEAEHAAAAERAAARKAVAASAPSTSSAADWAWDFAAIATAAGSSTAATGASGPPSSAGLPSAPASPGSSSLRGSGSPARVRLAPTGVAPTGSPTRFGQEAAAAGYLSPGQRLTSLAPQQQAADGERFKIKALHHVAESAAGVASPTAAAAAAAAGPPLITSSPVATTTAVVASEAASLPAKSPRLAPLPAGLPPKQGASGAGAGGEAHSHSQLLAQMV